MLNSLPDLDLRIHYTKARDGVNLAYWTAGTGEPLVFLPTMISNVESDWRTDRGRVYARLAENHLLVRYDGRGHGMSDRDPATLTLDTTGFKTDQSSKNPDAVVDMDDVIARSQGRC